MRGISLNGQIVIGATAGLLIGALINYTGSDGTVAKKILYLADLVGMIFINLLKMILIPVIFTSLATGISNLKSHAQMDRIWKFAMAYFLSTTLLASLTGLTIMNVFKPGVGIEVSLFKESMESFNLESLTPGQFLYKFLTGLFINPFEAMAAGNILPTVIFSIFIGIAIVAAKERGEMVHKLLNESFSLVMIIIHWIIRISPIGVMGLFIVLMANQNLSFIAELGLFIAIAIAGLLFHGLFTLPMLLRLVARRKARPFFAGMQRALLTAISTSSSAATLPVTIDCVENRLHVDKGVAGFMLPLGATINMDGTALYEALSALFVANLVGIELSLLQQCTVLLMTVIASIGAPGIPSAGMVTLIMVLQSVGLPVEAAAVLLPFDRFLDAIRTTINVEGDAIGCCIIDRLSVKSDGDTPLG